MSGNGAIRLLRVAALVAAAAALGPVSAQDEAGEPPASLTQRMIEELSSAYAGLAALVGDNPAEAVDWAEQDIENLGDWEYRIVEIDEDEEIAGVEAALNALGNDRWEVYWVAEVDDGTRFFLKRPAQSYLSRVPLSTLMRMLAGAGQ